MHNIAGYRTIYNGITFVTVKGTGHMVPQWKPKEAFYMMEQYFKNEDL
jgi:carboxypeptidase C (cathepsin A)